MNSGAWSDISVPVPYMVALVRTLGLKRRFWGYARLAVVLGIRVQLLRAPYLSFFWMFGPIVALLPITIRMVLR